mmetsp:Transcript_21671/g.77214  ORF Transcript_21671/g.77214 Transcript_21671/m.77214 type:complete len:223 (+) Transcript_21671:836-1504(+)
MGPRLLGGRRAPTPAAPKRFMQWILHGRAARDCQFRGDSPRVRRRRRVPLQGRALGPRVLELSVLLGFTAVRNSRRVPRQRRREYRRLARRLAPSQGWLPPGLARQYWRVLAHARRRRFCYAGRQRFQECGGASVRPIPSRVHNLRRRARPVRPARDVLPAVKPRSCTTSIVYVNWRPRARGRAVLPNSFVSGQSRADGPRTGSPPRPSRCEVSAGPVSSAI